MLRTAMSLAITLAASTVFAAGQVPTANEWYQNAQLELDKKLATKINTKKAKNIILFIADGNGVGTNTATRIWAGQQKGESGESYVLPFERMPHLGLAKTYNTNAQTPDSAGTGTAMQTGIKTKAGVLGVDESLSRGDCEGTAAAAVPSVGDLLAQKGKSVGYVSTARITHATPASGFAKSADRDYEDNSALPAGCTYPDIAAQLIQRMESGDVDLAMGGGRRHFLPKEVKGEEGSSGKRTDGRNLIEEAKKAGVQYAYDSTTFGQLKLDGKQPILGLFEASHMKYEFDRTGEPSLKEMTVAAIEALSNNKDGFYLMVEAGRVDHASHDGNLHRTVTDGVAFAEAVEAAMAMTKDKDTLIIVTADHEHAITFNGYCGLGTPITGLCYGIDNNGKQHNGELMKAKDGKPYTAVVFGNGAGSVLVEQADGRYVGERPDLTQAEATDPDYLQQALIPMSSETHTMEDVAVYAQGPWSHLINGSIEQNFIYHVMMHAATK